MPRPHAPQWVEPSEAKKAPWWVKLGEIDVDAGVVCVGDPCYLIDSAQWAEWVDKMHQPGRVFAEFNHTPFRDGTTVVVPSGWGDGRYAVYGLIRNGRCFAMVVTLIAESAALAGWIKKLGEQLAGGDL